MTVPSGEQVEIRRGTQRAVVTEVGATLRIYEAGGRAVVDGFDAAEMSPASHGHVLAPWPNRIADGRYRAPDGSEQQLPLTEPARLCAIHGLVHWLPWRVAERDEGAVRMECALHPTPGYPFRLQMSVAYALDGAGLRCTIAARNAGDAAAPYAAGQHPYFTCPGGCADDVLLRIPAGAFLETDERRIPTGLCLGVSGTALDFREERALGDTRLDHCFTDLHSDGDGVIRATLSDGASWRTTVWMRPPFRHLMLFSSDTLAPPRRRRALAVEPMTCPPNAFQSGADVVVLQPGDSHAATWGITPEPL